MARSRPLVAVYGPSNVREGDRAYALAQELGGELVRGGADVMTGGYGGVMEACSRGAAQASGRAIGVTVETYAGRGSGNPWVTERRHAPDLLERLRILIAGADGFVAVGGSLGTLTEVFLAWTMLASTARGRAPLVLLGEEWPPVLEALRRAAFLTPDQEALVRTATDPAQAARLVLAPNTATVRA
jgi:uncharacterized protein (TIGR00730 family)